MFSRSVVQSFSRSVVQSFSRSSLRGLTMLAATAVLGAGSAAHATSASTGTAHAQDFVRFDTTQPGVLVIDGSDHKTFLPLRDSSRTFATEADYFAFIHSVLNFAGDDTKSLSIYQAGQLYTYSSDLQSIIKVTDPVATAIGGRNGTVRIGETEHCIDADRCPNPVSPFTLRASDVYLWNSAVFTDQGVLPNAMDPNIQPMTAGAASWDFSIEAFLSHEITTIERDQHRGHKYSAETIARTSQKEGGFQVIEAYWVAPRLECDDVFLIDREGTCYHVPGELFVRKSEGQNALQASFLKVAGDLNIHGFCNDWTFRANSGVISDVPFVEARKISEAWGDDFNPNHRFQILPTWIHSTAKGWDTQSSHPPEVHGWLDLQVNQSPDC